MGGGSTGVNGQKGGVGAPAAGRILPTPRGCCWHGLGVKPALVAVIHCTDRAAQHSCALGILSTNMPMHSMQFWPAVFSSGCAWVGTRRGDNLIAYSYF